MSKNNINIDGAKLRSLLESVSGKSIYQVALGCGYSRNIIAEAIRKGVASPIVQNIAKLYGIEPSAYELKTPVVAPTIPESEAKDNQLSIADMLREDAKNELKALIKEAVLEVANNSELVIYRDPVRQTYRIAVRERSL